MLTSCVTWENGSGSARRSLEALLHVSEVRIDTWRTSTLGTLTDLRLVRLASAVAHGAHAGRVWVHDTWSRNFRKKYFLRVTMCRSVTHGVGRKFNILS